MPADKIDTQFLKGTVAAVLVRACAECAVSRPEDPVEFVSVGRCGLTQGRPQVDPG